MVREEIRRWRFWSWHFLTLYELENVKLAMDNIEVDLLGECYITCEDYLDDRITRVDFTQRIQDEIKKHKFPKNIRERIEIIEPHLKIFEEYMEHILRLDISEGYPTVDDFLMRKKEILMIL